MDCGLSNIVSRGADFTTAGICGPCRWMSPEVLDPPDDLSDVEEYRCLFTPASDVYSFGMTVLEVVTGAIPFVHRRYDTVVILDVIRGVLPQRPGPEVMSEDLWKLLQNCWQRVPERRPSAAFVESWLNTVYCMDDVKESSKSESSREESSSGG